MSSSLSESWESSEAVELESSSSAERAGGGLERASESSSGSDISVIEVSGTVRLPLLRVVVGSEVVVLRFLEEEDEDAGSGSHF